MPFPAMMSWLVHFRILSLSLSLSHPRTLCFDDEIVIWLDQFKQIFQIQRIERFTQQNILCYLINNTELNQFSGGNILYFHDFSHYMMKCNRLLSFSSFLSRTFPSVVSSTGGLHLGLHCGLQSSDYQSSKK